MSLDIKNYEMGLGNVIEHVCDDRYYVSRTASYKSM